MGTEIRGFKGGGMDSDSALSEIAANDFRAAWNFRTTGTAEGEEDEGTNIESTEEIEGTRADGLNKAIGAQGFEILRKGLAFIYNSQDLNQIIEIDYDTNEETILFTNKTDSGGDIVLPLDPQYYVTDIKLIGGFYVFTDSNMQPCYISRDRLIDGSYGVLTADDFLLIKAQILVPPTAAYNDDASRSVNLMSGNLFQFRNQVVYLDNEYSALSTISKRPVPTSEGTPAIGTDVAKNNNIIVSTHIGTNRVSRVIISARIGELDWFTIKDKNRADIILLPDTEVDVAQEIYEAYDPTTGLYSFAFYNDGLYNNLDVLETDLIADYVPLKAESVEILNGNVLALAGLTEGYLRPNPSIILSVSTYQPDISIDNPDAATSLRVDWAQDRPSGTSARLVWAMFYGEAKEGDEITIKIGGLSTGVIYTTIVYEVRPVDDGNTLNAIRDLATQIPHPTAVYESGGAVRLEFITRKESQTPDGDREEAKTIDIDLANAGSGASKSVSSLKLNSAYQLALAHYDRWGRPFPISTNDGYVIKTQSFSQLQGLASVINWEINSAAPEGAVSAQWLLSKNNTHESTLYVVGKISANTSQYIVVNINSLKEFNEGNNASILNYEFSEGDRCTFHYYDNSGIVWLSNPSIDVEVIGFDIEVTVDVPPVTNYLLKVRRSSQLDVDTVTGKNILLEIYTPRKRVITGSDGEVSLAPTLFYEIGNQIDIVDGEYLITSGQITDGDAYFKTRQLEDAITTDLEVYEVESFDFSDFYVSNFTSYGRPRSYYDVREREEKKASIRYSDVFRLGSEVNGITRFYPERIYGEGDGETSSDFGWINKIRQRDNYLVCIQEYKIWHIPIFTSILEDQTAQQNIAISDRILGQARGLQSGKFGMGGAKESYAESKNGTIYFIDPNNSIPLRDGYDGVKPISVKMSKFFKRVLQQAKKDGKKIIGWFDEFNQEYVVAIESVGDILTSFTFNSDNWLTEDDYTVIPADLVEETPPTKGSVTINTTTGIATYTPDLDELGSDSFEFTFMDGVTPVTKRVCIIIEEGNSDVFDFVFGDLIDKSLSTLYTSNSILIGGNNIPSPISITGGEYQITRDGVDLGWTSSAGFVNALDVVTVRQTSSGSYETTTNTTLTVGNQSDTFSVTTVGELSLSGQVLFSDIPVTNGPDPSDTYNIGFSVRYDDDNSLILSRSGAAGVDGTASSPVTIDDARAVDCYFELGVNNTGGGEIDTSRIRLEMWLDDVMLKAGYLTITNDSSTDDAAIEAMAASWVDIDLSSGGLLQLIGYDDPDLTTMYTLTIVSDTARTPNLEIIDDTDSNSLYSDVVVANITSGPFDLIPVVDDADTFTMILTGVDMAFYGDSIDINGIVYTAVEGSGTTYTYLNIPKENLTVTIESGG